MDRSLNLSQKDYQRCFTTRNKFCLVYELDNEFLGSEKGVHKGQIQEL